MRDLGRLLHEIPDLEVKVRRKAPGQFLQVCEVKLGQVNCVNYIYNFHDSASCAYTRKTLLFLEWGCFRDS